MAGIQLHSVNSMTSTLPTSAGPVETDLSALLAAVGAGKPQPITVAEAQALERLLLIARGDTGQSRRVADFLLAWWNAGTCGSFDLTSLWSVDATIAADMTAVFGLVARIQRYPDTLGYEAEFNEVVKAWRPELVERAG